MSLAPGTKLGPYEIVALLGAGGMGEVYRARDSRLARTVAVKVLPEHLSQNVEAKERFEREARAISSLSHPNICHLYDVGLQQGTSYLVMEYLEGETLADRLRKGPLPLDHVLKLGIEICEGLQKAHHSQVVHRDLKPANIMLTKSGAKLMDFGLAKPVAASVGASSSSPSLATLSQPLTAQGTIVGTFQYISPEQLEGVDADARSDIFSLGAVLYEMFTGKRAFEGKTTASTIAAILAGQPKPVSSMLPTSPPALDHLLRACLAKDPEERVQTVHDVKLQLQWISTANSQLTSAATTTVRKSTTPWVVAAIAVAAVLAGWSLARLWTPTAARNVVRSSILPPDKTSFAENTSEWAPVAVSPDGSRIVVGLMGENNRPILYVRPLNELIGRTLAGTEGGTFPFWSPDGRFIGFFADGQLKIMEATGGPVESICAAPQARGGTWNKDGVIVFAPSPFTGLFRVVATTGSVPEPLTTLDTSRHEDSHRWPQFLPDGRHILYLARTSDRSKSEIHLASFDKSQPSTIVRANGNPIYAQSGFLLYPRGNVVLAQPFNADSFRISGEPQAIADEVSASGNIDYASFSASANGVFAYKKSIGEGISQLVWTDHTGKVLDKVAGPAGYYGPALSPDGHRLAVEIQDPHGQANSDIWIYDLVRNTRTRLTFSQPNQHNRLPVWSPDGSHIIFSSDRSGASQQLYIKSAGGNEPEHPLSPGERDRYPTTWSPDGRYIAGVQQSPQRGTEFLVLPVSETQQSLDFLPGVIGLSRFSFPRISPNGKWIAYASFESGRGELYISSFPSGTGKWQVSSGGSRDAVWRHDSKEIFFVSLDDTMMSAQISEQNGAPVVGAVQPLFRTRLVSSPHWVFDISSDGKRFLVNTLLQSSSAEPLTLVVNWDAELKKK